MVKGHHFESVSKTLVCKSKYYIVLSKERLVLNV